MKDSSIEFERAFIDRVRQRLAAPILTESEVTLLEQHFRANYAGGLSQADEHALALKIGSERARYDADKTRQESGQKATYEDLNKQAQQQTSEELVESRKALYGTFCGRAELTVSLLEVCQGHPKWHNVPSWGKWAITMLIEKIGRIIEGDPKYEDNWKDIGGYAELARRNATGEKA